MIGYICNMKHIVCFFTFIFVFCFAEYQVEKENVERLLGEFHDIDDILKMKRPNTGFYANPNPNRAIVVDSRFFPDPPGVERMLNNIHVAWWG